MHYVVHGSDGGIAGRFEVKAEVIRNRIPPIFIES